MSSVLPGKKKKKKDSDAADAKKPPGALASRVQSVRDSPMFKLLMFLRSEAAELASQYGAFRASPQALVVDIRGPILHGWLIAASAFLTPVLYFMRCEKTLALFNGALSVAYVVIAIPNL